MARLSAADVWKNPPLWLSTWFGSGLSPIMPGTAGSLATLPVAFVIHYYLGAFALLGFSALTFFIGWWASNETLKRFPDRPDPGYIVIDEVAAQSLLLAALFPTWQSYVLGFVFFRFFDMVKPWPISWADRNIKGGLGVMVDDILAGVYPIALYYLTILISKLCGIEQNLDDVFAILGGTNVY